MSKILMGPQILVYPMPTFLVGANVDNKPNFMAVSWGGIANADPPMISVAIRHQRHTYRGIRQNMTFSVNVPSIDLVRETDYCGIKSGAKVNKVEACQFNVFYGKLNNAPLIEQCPINHECKVMHILNLGSHAFIIGRIEATHTSESCLTDGNPDINKVRPFVCIREPDSRYRALGEVIAKAFSVGQELKAKDN